MPKTLIQYGTDFWEPLKVRALSALLLKLAARGLPLKNVPLFPKK